MNGEDINYHSIFCEIPVIFSLVFHNHRAVSSSSADFATGASLQSLKYLRKLIKFGRKKLNSLTHLKYFPLIPSKSGSNAA